MNTQSQKIIKSAIAAIIISGLTLPTFYQLSAETIPIAQQSTIEFTPPPPPPDRDAPGSRGGGAGRGCGAGTQSVTALMPEYKQVLERGAITKVWGTTIAERPTFWFDVPYQKNAIAAVEFVLQSASSPTKEIYRSAIEPPTTPGIISIRLPASVPPLEVGASYQWFFKLRLRCGSEAVTEKTRIQKEELHGWVQRISSSPTLTRQLKQATPQQRTVLYAQNGIWFDALTTLAEQRLSHPQDTRLMGDWQRLLRSINLEPLTMKPLISCCQPRS